MSDEEDFPDSTDDEDYVPSGTLNLQPVGDLINKKTVFEQLCLFRINTISDNAIIFANIVWFLRRKAVVRNLYVMEIVSSLFKLAILH